MSLTPFEAVSILAMLVMGLALCTRRQKRNRWLASPKPDTRSSIEQFKRMHQP